MLKIKKKIDNIGNKMRTCLVNKLNNGWVVVSVMITVPHELLFYIPVHKSKFSEDLSPSGIQL